MPSVSPYVDISQHGVNTVWVITELVLPRTNPISWVNLPILIVIGALYIGLAYLTLATRHFYVYSFLNPAEVGGRGIVAAYCVGLLVAASLLFVLICGAIWVRRWLTEDKAGMRGKFGKRHDGPTEDVRAGRRRKDDETGMVRDF